MTKIELNRYHGYFWDLEECALYSNKKGSMVPLKLQKERSFPKYGRLRIIPEHYQTSKNGYRRNLTVEQIYRLIVKKHVHRAIDAIQ